MTCYAIELDNGEGVMAYENLEVWRRAKNLSVEIYRCTAGVRDFGFRDQITRSGLSVPSNIAEGFERESARECVNFLSYAKGSTGELRTQIYIGKEIGYVPEKLADLWINETIEIGSMLRGLIKNKRLEISRHHK
jgi:four helix bundle protein